MAFTLPIHLSAMPARAAACRAGITRAAFAPRDTDPLVMPDTGDNEYYDHREQIVAANPHTVVTQ